MAAELDDLHLADLHERAAAAGISGFRLMRREELIAALNADSGPSGDEAPAAGSDADAEAEPKPRRRRRGRRRRAEPEPEAEPDTNEMAVVEATVLDDAADQPVELE